jgi:hypothetical protein
MRKFWRLALLSAVLLGAAVLAVRAFRPPESSPPAGPPVVSIRVFSSNGVLEDSPPLEPGASSGDSRPGPTGGVSFPDRYSFESGADSFAARSDAKEAPLGSELLGPADLLDVEPGYLPTEARFYGMARRLVPLLVDRELARSKLAPPRRERASP